MENIIAKRTLHGKEKKASELRASGLSYAKIAVRLNESRSSVYASLNSDRLCSSQAVYREEHGESIQARKRQWAKENAESIAEKHHSYYLENRDRLTMNMRQRRELNPERIRKEKQEEYKKHRGRYLSNVQRWQSENKERVREYKRKSKLLRQAVQAIALSAQSLESIYREQRGRCYYCGVEMNNVAKGPKMRTLEHILPIVRGGAHSLNNVAWVCLHCNTSKGAKTLEEYKEYIGHGITGMYIGA